MSAPATRYPALANATAVARPIPRAAPVMTTTLFSLITYSVRRRWLSPHPYTLDGGVVEVHRDVSAPAAAVDSRRRHKPTGSMPAGTVHPRPRPRDVVHRQPRPVDHRRGGGSTERHHVPVQVG